MKIVIVVGLTYENSFGESDINWEFNNQAQGHHVT